MDVKAIVAKYRPDLAPYEQIYRDIHRNPELSKQESRTADIAACHLEGLHGFEVYRGIGGHGVVGVLKNGSGSTVLLRADMDALPHREETKLDYASTRVTKDFEGKETPVMHACGHDMHTTSLMAAAAMLQAARSEWRGTLICLFQPDEETAGGAQAMVNDGLYDPKKYGIPIPNVVLAQHVIAFKSGVVALSAGPILTTVDSFEVRIFGKSGHICRADLCVDPVVTASHIIVRLQTLVTKEVRPEDFAVIGCTSVHGGNAPNVIPDYVDIKISIRSYRPEVHERVLASVKRVIRAECEASGSLQIREPTFKTIMHAPPTINDAEQTRIVKNAFNSYFGDNSIPLDPLGPSEDCSILATACNAPLVYTLYGIVEPKRWEKALKEDKVSEIPQYHSAFFAPAIQPTMQTGVDAFAVSALAYLQRCRYQHKKLRSTLAQYPDAKTIVRELNLASLCAVHKFTSATAKDTADGRIPPLAGIVCHAYYWNLTRDAEFTGDGYEKAFQVSHLAHVALVGGLLDSFGPAGGRVLLFSSDAHWPGKNSLEKYPPALPDDLERLVKPASDEPTDTFGRGFQKYAISKLVIVMWMYALNRYLEQAPSLSNIAAVAINPGNLSDSRALRTNTPTMLVYMSKFVIQPLRPLLRLMDPTMRTSAEAGTDVIDLATNKAYPGERGYFTMLQKDDSSRESQDKEKQRKVWVKSAEWAGITWKDTV